MRRRANDVSRRIILTPPGFRDPGGVSVFGRRNHVANAARKPVAAQPEPRAAGARKLASRPRRARSNARANRPEDAFVRTFVHLAITVSSGRRAPEKRDGGRAFLRRARLPCCERRPVGDRVPVARFADGSPAVSAGIP